MPAKTPARRCEAQHPGLKEQRSQEREREGESETEKQREKKEKKEKIAPVLEREGREKGTILFVLWSKHAPGFMKGVKSWRLIEK